MDVAAPLSGVFAALQSAMPNIDAFLSRAVRGTNLLQGKPEDYILSLVMAIAFPFARFAVDRTVYDVSVAWSLASIFLSA